MKITVILTLILFILLARLFAQQTMMDSLQQKLTHATENERILILADFFNTYRHVDLTKLNYSDGKYNLAKEYNILCSSYKQLSDYYEKSGNFKKSNECLKMWMTANESINTRKFISKTNEFQFRYETEKKQIYQRQRIIKEKDKLIIILMIAGSMLLVGLVIIFILFKIRKQADKLLITQIQENSSISYSLINENETQDEVKYHPTALDEGLKRQIVISLNKQLDLNVFKDPDITLKILAQKCQTNRSYLSHVIHELYSMNFNTFINTLRISEAKKMLDDKSNNLPLKELYLKLGYNSYSVFNEAFKKNIGVTPACYLRTFKKGVDGEQR